MVLKCCIVQIYRLDETFTFVGSSIQGSWDFFCVCLHRRKNTNQFTVTDIDIFTDIGKEKNISFYKYLINNHFLTFPIEQFDNSSDKTPHSKSRESSNRVGCQTIQNQSIYMYSQKLRLAVYQLSCLVLKFNTKVRQKLIKLVAPHYGLCIVLSIG